MKTQEWPTQAQVSSAEHGRDQRPPRTKRFLLWCLANFVIWPILGLVAKKLRLFQFLFVVYPGSQNNIRAYAPMWFQRIFKGVFQLSVIGVMTRGKGTGRGLIVTLSESPETLSKEELRGVSERIKGFGERAEIPSIALAGRLPTLFAANDIPLKPPFIKGEKGAVFTITETYVHLLRERGISLGDPVGIVGVGYLGTKVADRLQELGCGSVIGYDIRIKETHTRGNLTRTNDPKLLTPCRVVILLTPRGEDAADVLPWLQEGVMVIDDTHPQLPPDLIHSITQKKGEVYRSTMGIEGIRSVPRLPGYDKRWIPGCVVESLVMNGKFNGTTQAEFDRKAREIGLRPFLVSPRGEG